MSPKSVQIVQNDRNFDPKTGKFVKSKNENHVTQVLFHKTQNH